MTTTRVTKKDAVAVLRKIATENPDRTNNGACRYTREDGDGNLVPNCIAGVALVEVWGFKPEHLAVYDGPNTVNNAADDVLKGNPNFTPGAVEAIRSVQSEADYDGLSEGTTPWRTAFLKAQRKGFTW